MTMEFVKISSKIGIIPKNRDYPHFCGWCTTVRMVTSAQQDGHLGPNHSQLGCGWPHGFSVKFSSRLVGTWNIPASWVKHRPLIWYIHAFVIFRMNFLMRLTFFFLFFENWKSDDTNLKPKHLKVDRRTNCPWKNGRWYLSLAVIWNWSNVYAYCFLLLDP